MKILLILIALISYILLILIYFYYMKLPIPTDTDTLGQFGDYIGGVLNPLFGIISIILIINQINTNKKQQIELMKQYEKDNTTKEFNNLFFHLIKKNTDFYLNHFKISIPTNKSTKSTYFGNEATELLQKLISEQKYSKSTTEITKILENPHIIKHNIISCIRYFYLTLKHIDNTYHNIEIRKKYYTLLINMTEFDHFLLILIAIKYLGNDYPSIKYISSNVEFMSTLRTLGVKLNEI